ncbi:hypothetical protein ScalyP_jg7389 [Parmales sp. scaly parma]|nr:hypothetical protein ScalyP_jg7389 [Parmales sp. scaly parma]
MRSDSSSKIKNQNAVSTSSTSQLSLYRDADFASSSSSGNLLPGQSPLVAPAPTSSSTAITARSASNLEIPTPSWHPSWKIHSVISGHLGWVRSVAFDPGNEFFVTGSADRTIKVWDFAKASVAAPDALKLTLTGHINAVRGLAISPRHPYMFSCGEDKMVKCWDLEYNKVIRQYHGHLSGVFCLKLHPTLDILITGGRDACARVWDMRTKEQIHCLGGHEGTVASILTNGVDPQVVTGGHDSKVKLWDLAAGKVMTTLTHHKKSVRALASHPSEFSFMSAGADNIKKWQGKDGRFIQNFPGHNAVVNAMTCNADGVLVSGGDDGSMRFWDYKTGYQFQAAETVVQPGSLEAEKGIYALAFDETGTRLVTCEADKTIKIWSEDKEASEVNEPIDKKRWRKQCIAEARSRY